MKRNVLLACSFALCIFSPRPAEATTAYKKLVPTDGALGRDFGFSVATDGERVIVGARQFGSPGAAYVFDKTTGLQLAKLTPQGGQINQMFGESVDIDGNFAVVGSSGGGYLFDLSNVNNIVQKKLVPSEGLAGDIGQAVAISGNTVIASAPFEMREGKRVGAAYLFNATTGSQFAKLISSDGADGDNFGIAVAIDGATAIVGAPLAHDQINERSGAVYQFEVGNGAAVQTEVAKYAVNLPPSTNPFFGSAVDVDGTTIIAGASNGQAYLWKSGGTPTPLAGSAFPRSFGNFVGVDENFAIVGKYAQLSGIHPQESANVYSVASGALTNSLRSDHPAAWDGFGISAAVDGGAFVVGAIGLTEEVAYVFYAPIPEPVSGSLAWLAIPTLLAFRQRS